MKTFFRLGIVVLLIVASCVASAIFTAKNGNVSAAIRAFVPDGGSAAVADMTDVKPYPMAEFAEEFAYDLGGQAYLWFYARWRMILEERDFVEKHGAEINTLLKYRDPPTAKDHIYVTPNLDVLNIVAYFDLAEQPQILSIPEMDGERYYTFMFVDAWHNLIANISRQHHPEGGVQVALVGPDWEGELPEGVIRLDSPTNTVALLGRIRVSPEIPADVTAAQALLDQVSVEGLEAMTGAPRDTGALPGQSYELIDPNARQTTAIFDNYREILRRNPPYGKDAVSADLFEEIIPGAGLQPNPLFLSGLRQAAVHSQRMITTAPIAGRLNGWRLTPPELSTPDWSWLLRSSLMEYGILVNTKEESVYITTSLDADLKSMTGGQSYELSLPSPPPVNEFWSVTVYDIATAQLIDNPWNKYRIGDNTPGLTYEPDGSLRLFISPEPPEDERYLANWISNGDDTSINLNVVMRIYGPTDEILDQTWFPENWRRS